MSPFAVGTLLVLFIANAYFVAAEFALVSVRRPRLAAMADEGVRGSRRALAQFDDMGRSLSACQLGITLASIGIGALGEPAVGHALEGVIGHHLPHTATTIVSIFLAYLLVTSVHITAGEQVPKMAAIANAEKVACLLSLPLDLFGRSLRPFIWLLDRATDMMLGALRIQKSDEHGHAVTGADILALIAESAKGGTLDGGEAGMLHGVFDLHERTARDVMTHAPEISAVRPDQTVREALEQSLTDGHSRLLVIGDELDGMLTAHDLTRMVLQGRDDEPVSVAVRPVQIVPESKPLDDLLALMQTQKVSVAAVVDEYGQTSGVVSVEDIVEEIVGEIDDETDTPEPAAVPDGPDAWLIGGQVTLTDLADEGIVLPDAGGTYATLAGLLMHQSGSLPAVGEQITFDGWQAEVVERDGARIAQVRLVRLAAAAA